MGSAINNLYRSVDGKKDGPTRPKRDRTQKLSSYLLNHLAQKRN